MLALARAAGTFAFQVNVTNGAGATLSKTCTVASNAVPFVSKLAVTQATKGAAKFSGAMAVSVGTPDYTCCPPAASRPA